jgi:hypothetical protein
VQGFFVALFRGALAVRVFDMTMIGSAFCG